MASDGVIAWVHQSQDRLLASPFVQTDLDDLAGGLPKFAARVAIQMFQTVCSEASDSSIPLLVLPLPPSKRLITKPPSLARLVEQRSDPFSVPAFYLTTRSLWAEVDPVEEYRRPVNEEVPEADGLSCYYRVHRSLEERHRGWEFTRGFYLRRGE